MHCVDVNVLAHACIRSAPRHELALATLERLRDSPRGLGVFSVVASGFVRIATDRRVFPEPIDAARAMEFLDALLASPRASVVNPGARHWGMFCELVRQHRPSSTDITDVYLAAAALEANATWVSFDRGFARFSDLNWLNPADA